jgi:type IV pilus assembly protein PilM
MGSPKRFLVLDLGMQSLRLAEFSGNADGKLKLIRGARRELLLDPTLDASRPEQIQSALKEILKEWCISHSIDVSCVLPAHMVFTRVVSLDIPGGINGQVDALARFEAQQNIPFPLEEVIWDYVIMGENHSGGVNIAFLAIKSDILDATCRAIGSTGLRICAITVAPMALYDAYRFAYPGASGSTNLLLDMGSRTTNLIITKEGSFFSRSIPTGGLAVTMAIAKDIHADISEAENLKITRGSVALGPGFHQPTDPIEANLGRVTRQTLLKTQADITRSIGFYRSTLGGNDPELIMISGGMAGMPYLSEFLTEKLQKETVFFDPKKSINFTPESNVFIENNASNLGELIGGALQYTQSSCTLVSLLPPSITRKENLAKRLPYLAATGLIFLLTLLCWSVFAQKAATFVRDETAKLESAVQTEETISKKMDALGVQQSSIKKTADQLLSVLRLHEAYPKILAELSAKVPESFLWITEIKPLGESVPKGQVKNDVISYNEIVVKGLYLDNPRQAAVIDDFVNSLQNSEIFYVEEKSKSKIIVQRGSPNGEFWAYPFSLKIPLRNNITIIP